MRLCAVRQHVFKVRSTEGQDDACARLDVPMLIHLTPRGSNAVQLGPVGGVGKPTPNLRASSLATMEQTMTTETVSPPGAGASPKPETIRLKPTSGFGRVLSPRELWRYRDLAFQIAARDVTVRYRQTALGAAWAVLQPVGFMVVFSLFFGRVAGISSDGIPYAVFSLAGLVAWTYFANALLLGSESLVNNSALVSKIYFPRIFMPAGVLAAGFVDLAISLVILFVVVFAAGLVP